MPFFISIPINYLSDILHFNQVFSNLNGIQSGTFLNLVAYNPESQTVFVSQVFTDTTYIYRVVFPARNNGIGYSFFSGLSISTRPSPLANASRASSTDTGRSVSIQMLSECERSAGTRTQVALTCTSECMILRVSLYIFISSLV